jgi:CBS domain-containing protein
MNCPYCGADNLDGVDDCAECGQSLSDAHLTDPPTAVEQSLLADHLQVLDPQTPVVVSADTPVRDVLRAMVDGGTGCVVVADGDRSVGIFSERDALMRLNTAASALGDRPVSEFMTAEPETLEPTAKVVFAVQRMDVGGYRHIPIIDEGGELAGIVSVRDILRYLTDKMGESRESAR